MDKSLLPSLKKSSLSRPGASCPVCLYAGSLVPRELLDVAPRDAHIRDTASMTLDEIISEMKKADAEGKDVARVHSGDPSLYGAIAEQMRRLDDLGIAYDVTPGVSAYSAAAAALRQELTLPEISQTLIATRTSMHASAMPEGEDLKTLGKSGATLAIHLSIRNLKHVEETLKPLYGEDCPAIVAYRVGWPDEQFIRGTLATIREKVRQSRCPRCCRIPLTVLMAWIMRLLPLVLRAASMMFLWIIPSLCILMTAQDLTTDSTALRMLMLV